MKLQVETESWPYVTAFRITNYVFTDADLLVVSLEDGGAVGRGEASGVYYRGETPASMAAQIEAIRLRIEAGLDRAALAGLLPPGGARNALDAALWDLEARRRGEPAWRLAGVPAPRPLLTTFTVGADTPEAMARAAMGYGGARALKIKLTADDPLARVRAVRAARPDAWLGIDANQGFTRASLEAILPGLIDAGVSLIEQPLPVGEEGALVGLRSPIPIAADETVQGLADLKTLAGRFDAVNIKLDKCGGLTEGLAMAREARRLGLKVMVGCMSGTSLGMAPAFLLGQLCDFVDLDAPTFLAADRSERASYTDGLIWCPDAVWGAPVPADHPVAAETVR